MTIDIERYLRSLSEDIVRLDISFKDITFLPPLTRFNNIQELYCYNNRLTSLPPLPPGLKSLYCSNNKFTSLPPLPPGLQVFYCSDNELTSLPPLPQSLKSLYCSNNKFTSLPPLPPGLEAFDCYDNQLTSLPSLPEYLKYLDCSKNKLTSLPPLPQSIQVFYCSNNPIYEIVNGDCTAQIKQNIQIVNKCRYLRHCLKLKEQLRKWLWEKVREPNAREKYNPKYLIDNLGQDDDLDTVLDNWTAYENA